jgi:hypothetical protein
MVLLGHLEMASIIIGSFQLINSFLLLVAFLGNVGDHPTCNPTATLHRAVHGPIVALLSHVCPVRRYCITHAFDKDVSVSSMAG